MKITKANEIFSSFKIKYDRETNYLLNLYELTEDYMINQLIADKNINWYRFRVAVKLIRERRINLENKMYYTSVKLLIQERLRSISRDEHSYQKALDTVDDIPL